MVFDGLVVVSFGGPEGPEEVRPFLDNVLRGRRVPAARVEQVAAQYQELGGVSPINGQNRALVAALEQELGRRGRSLPVYWGNRNWHPLLPETVCAMRDDGVVRAAAFVTSAYSSYSSCRQYIENIQAARAAIGPDAPEILKLPPFCAHPGFVGPLADGLRVARSQAGPSAPVLMTAHSIPTAMADESDYVSQLRATGDLVAAGAGEPPGAWSLVFQSRSGPPEQSWLEPDILDALAALPSDARAVIVVPLGFVSDHMEVVYDLDRQVMGAATARGLAMIRTPTPGSDPRFVSMILDLLDSSEAGRPAAALGGAGPRRLPCTDSCCPPAAGHPPVVPNPTSVGRAREL
jgi:ferrochelatase